MVKSPSINVSPKMLGNLAGLVVVLAVAGVGVYMQMQVQAVPEVKPTYQSFPSVVDTDMKIGGTFGYIKNLVPVTQSQDAATKYNESELNKPDISQYN